MKRDSRVRNVFACATICFGGLSSVTLAQTATTSSEAGPAVGPLEEIVVTALRRSESIQTVPASITALSGEQLQESGAQGFADYLRSIPNVSFVENSFRRTSFYIRGITDGSSQSDPTTAIYINEAPISEGLAATADVNLFDLNRVEVLRGPQGTLYGASSMGGTIRFILNKARSDKFEALTDATVSTTANGGTNYNVNGMVNVPIVPDLFALRGTVSYKDNDGFIDNTKLGRDNVNTLHQASGRLSAMLTPSKDVTVELSMLYQRDYFGGQADTDVGLGPYQQSRLAPEQSTRNTRLYSIEVNADLGFANLMSATNYFDKANRWGGR